MKRHRNIELFILNPFVLRVYLETNMTAYVTIASCIDWIRI